MSSGRTEEPTDLLAQVGVEALTLARGPWRLGDDSAPRITTALQPGRPYRGGIAWRLLRSEADAQWEAAIQRGATIYGRPPEPPGLLRLTDYRQTDAGDLALTLGPTWYWSFLGSNVAVEFIRRQPSHDLARLEREAPTVLSGSLLANPLTVNLCIIFTADDPPTLLLQQRGRAIRRHGERYVASAGGFADRGDLRHDSIPAPWRTAVREAAEETGIELEPEHITFLALCRSRGGFIPGMCGVTEVPEASAGRQLRISHDQHELAGYELWPFEPDSVLRRVLAAGGWAAFHPLSAAAIVHALGARFGNRAVLAAWQHASQAAAVTPSAPQE